MARYQLAMHVVSNGRAHFGIYPYQTHFGIYPYQNHFGIHPLRYIPLYLRPLRYLPTSVFTNFDIRPYVYPDKGIRG